MAASTAILVLNHIECPNCGTVFGISSDFEKRRREDHQSFWCPRGHSMSYGHETAAERLARELKTERDRTAREKHLREQAEARAAAERRAAEKIERSLRGTKAVVTRMKRRTSAGRCPCCSHQFKNLEQHMKAQHPKWNPDRAAEALAAK